MRPMLRSILVTMSVIALAVASVGCEERASTSAPAFNKRAVVMSPALTQIIIDLGKGDSIVGVGRYDPRASEYTVVGDLYNMDYEKLLALEPTNLYLQPAKDGTPNKLLQLAGDKGWLIHVYEIETIADVKRAIFDGSGRGVGMTIGAHYEALDLVERIEAQLLAVGTTVGDKPLVETVMLVGLNPITAAGPRTFLNEMLVYAGGVNAIADETNRYPVLDKEGLLALKPELIVVADPSGDLNQADLPEWLSEAADRVAVLSDPQALLPSSTVPRVTAKLAKLLHPDLAEQIDQAMTDAVQE